MSWHTDPQLFIRYIDPSYGYYVHRIVKKYNTPLFCGDFVVVGKLDFSVHLSLGNNINKESDYDALKSILRRNSFEVNYRKVMQVNCQGLVAYFDYTSDTGVWSPEEEIHLVIKALPCNINPTETAVLTEKLQAVEKRISELVAEISLLKEKSEKEATNLQEQLSQEKKAKQAFSKNSELVAKLQECGGAGSGSGDVKPWMRGDSSVPSHWVAPEDLDVLKLPKNTPVTIMEGPSKPRFVEDVTTNVPVNRFYRGTFIVGVNVEELAPDKEKARFDPEFWGLYSNAGIHYAARKCLEKEMSV